MEEYLHYMKTLRTHMNDVEDQAAKISVEEQMQITTIHTLESDLNSAKRETKRLMEETEQMVKSRGDLCSEILEKQKKVMALESDSFNLSQTLELILQERSNFAAKVVEKSSYYAKVSEDMISGLQEQKRWLDEKLQNEISEGDDMQTDATDEISSNGYNVASSLGDEAKEEVLARLHAAEAKLGEIIQLRTRLAAENSEMKQSIEQIAREINDLKPELSAMETITLEEEHKALLSEKDAETEYMQSLQNQLEKLRGISHKVKCACGEEFKIQMERLISMGGNNNGWFWGVIIIIYCSAITVLPKTVTVSLNHTFFPQGFVFGVASSAYQYEGAVMEDGRGPSVWDTYAHKYPGKIKDGSNGDVAADSYHRYKEDVKIIKEMGLDAYRISISWSRILPKGKLRAGANWKGIRYYNDLINELIHSGIKPFVTLLHGDLPQALEDDYGGFLSTDIIDDFRDYADLCYREFGDRVKHWMTLNEPLYYDISGYAVGNGPPGRCSKWLNLNCTGGDSGTEPYTVAHNLILAHAAASKLYKEKYQKSQKGEIGIVLAANWVVPFSKSAHHREAAQRALDFTIGWFMEPLTRGDYPHSMRSIVMNRLPKFTRKESKMVKGSFDFIGLNYYSASYATNDTVSSNTSRLSYLTDWHVTLLSERNGVRIGPKGVADGMNIYPRGIKELLLHMRKKYMAKNLYITENGIGELNNSSLSLKEALNDITRIDYHYHHLSFLREAIQDGVDVRGYFAWSLLDNFEWGAGYTIRYGFNFVDFGKGLERHPKKSALWFKNFLKK
ncbi:beta-glucosidase 13-like [Silene latifolia]|uniref:beta-glucosidase 13-like n=1 Tax=Silene latifolia TaxID=37657 RepID=UPI003D770F90